MVPHVPAALSPVLVIPSPASCVASCGEEKEEAEENGSMDISNDIM